MPTSGFVNSTIFNLFIDGVKIFGTKSHTFNSAMATRDATTKESGGNEEVLESMKSYEFSFDGLHAEDSTYGYTDLHAVLRARTQVQIKISSQVSGDTQYTGFAYITSLDREGTVEETETFSGTMKVTGDAVPSTFT